MDPCDLQSFNFKDPTIIWTQHKQQQPIQYLIKPWLNELVVNDRFSCVCVSEIGNSDLHQIFMKSLPLQLFLKDMRSVRGCL